MDATDGPAPSLAVFVIANGTSVSIALLREGRPVLGVVYAYCAPDDVGDCFTWAEGTGPVRRNGREGYPPRGLASLKRFSSRIKLTAIRRPTRH